MDTKKNGSSLTTAEKQATHFAVPIPVFEAVRKVLGTLPFDQIAGIMNALADSKPLALLVENSQVSVE